MLKGDIRKQAILDTAENLFFEKGYVKATIQDFLDALECSKGSFYHHFESKLQVLTELCRQRTAKSFEAYQEKKKARTGYVVETYKVYKQNGVETRREWLCTSNYPMIQQVIEYN